MAGNNRGGRGLGPGRYRGKSKLLDFWPVEGRYRSNRRNSIAYRLQPPCIRRKHGGLPWTTGVYTAVNLASCTASRVLKMEAVSRTVEPASLRVYAGLPYGKAGKPAGCPGLP